MQVILNHQQIQQKITRLGHELLENCFEENKIFIGGIQGNGFELAKKIAAIIPYEKSKKTGPPEIKKKINKKAING